MIEPVGSDGRAGTLGPEVVGAVGFLFDAGATHVGTCFLVADWWIATAFHVMPSKPEAAAYIAVFNFVQSASPRERDAYATAPEQGIELLNAPELDVTLVRLLERPAGVPPAVRWGRVDLGAARDAIVGDPVCVVQHRKRPAFKAYASGRVLGTEGSMLLHGAACDAGASGAPLFDAAASCIGVHKGAGGGAFRATAARAAVEALRERALAPELRAALGP